MPILGIDRNELYWKFFLLGCYISVTEYPEYRNHFFLLFQFKKEQAYNTVKSKLEEHELFEKEFKHNTQAGDYCIFAFKIPEEHEEDVILFKNGKYSKFSKEHKTKIRKVHKLNDKKPLHHILKRSKSRRLKLSRDLAYDIPEDLDLWDKPYDHEEILVLENLL